MFLRFLQGVLEIDPQEPERILIEAYQVVGVSRNLAIEQLKVEPEPGAQPLWEIRVWPDVGSTTPFENKHMLVKPGLGYNPQRVALMAPTESMQWHLMVDNTRILLTDFTPEAYDELPPLEIEQAEPSKCGGCGQTLSWSPSGTYCGNEQCREFNDTPAF